MSKDTLSKTGEEIRLTLCAGYSVIYLVTTEEDRAVELVQQAASRVRDGGYPEATWSATDGLVIAGAKPIKGSTDPHVALRQVAEGEGPGLFFFHDLHPYLKDPEVVRHLRDVYHAGLGQDRHLFLLASVLTLPLELRKEVAVVDVPPPSLDELEPVLDAALAHSRERGLQLDELSRDERTPFLRAIQGLTRNEGRHVLAKALADHGFDENAVRAIQTDKAKLIRKEGMLQYIPHGTRLADVGGLENLKDWLIKRRQLFLRDPEEVGEMMPRGLLMMGVSGCGKSLSVKAIAHHWELPLFRLDMNEVFSGEHGQAEQAFARGLRAAETLSPCVLWIDEIEGGITGYESEHGGSTWRIFSTFLTWMQEKMAPVFVAATANRIDLLPAEMLRKGRFDQIFFLDLPSETDREEIFRVHLGNRNNDLEQFDLTILSRGTKGWNGAEIENCVVAGMVEAYADDRTMAPKDLYEQLSELVPLSTTMAEQIKAIRSWAHDRAVKAGR